MSVLIDEGTSLVVSGSPSVISRTVAPGVNGPSNLTPNQVPNSPESDSARHTRFLGARRRIFFSMWSVLMRNLQVADQQDRD